MAVAGGELFVGRSGELGVLRDLVADVAQGRGGSVLVEGEPGIGKSALLAAGLDAAPGLGCRVLRGMGDELGQAFPLRVLADSLGEEYRAEVVAPAGHGDPVPAAVERFLAHLDRLCVRSPVVFVLDDLQWADAPSLAAWHRLSLAVDQLPLLLVGANRPVPRRAEVTQLREKLAAGGTRMMLLGPLPPEEAAEMAGSLLRDGAGPTLRLLTAQAGGNPMYLREIVDALVREGLTGTAAGALPVPRSLSEAIADRLGFLSEPIARMLRLAALLGVTFSAGDLAVVLGRAPADLAERIEEARVSGVLTGTGAHLAFRHPLIRQALYEATPAALRGALHHQAAQALAGIGVPVGRVAEQLLAAGEIVDNWVLDWLVAHVGELADRAPQIAEDLLRRAIGHAQATDPRRQELATVLVELLFRLDRYAEAATLAASTLARPVSAALKGRLTWTLGYALMRTGRLAEAETVLAAALAAPDLAPAAAARLTAMRSVVFYNSGPRVSDWSVGERASAMAEEAKDGFALAFTLHGMSLPALVLDAPGALKFIDDGLAALEDDPDSTSLRLVMLSNRISALVGLERIEEALAESRTFIVLTDRGVVPPSHAQKVPIWLDFLTGDWDDAIIGLENQLGADGEASLGYHDRVWAHGLRALIAGHRDDRATATQHLAAAPTIDLHDLPNNSFYLLYAMSLAAERAGRLDDALSLLVPPAGPRYEEDLLGRGRFLDDVVRLALSIGDPTVAGAATRTAEEAAGGNGGPAEIIVALRCRGMLEADPATLEAAVTRCRAAMMPLRLAATLEDLAVVRAQRGDTDAARVAFLEAVDHYDRLGATWDTMRADSRLRALGIRRGQRGPRRRAAIGWEALTPTELTVARLVRTGLSNPDIAAELYLSRRTVQTHVSHILAKLGARSRQEIARADTSR
jgi:DNA-binding CsgD family transcriptional regulator/tetratricopeptide (TPR) repeat protein